MLTADLHANHKCSLKRILKKKLLRLTNPTMYQRRILLIWNSYYFGDPATVRDALADI